MKHKQFQINISKIFLQLIIPTNVECRYTCHSNKSVEINTTKN